MFHILFRRAAPIVLVLLLTLTFAGPAAASPGEGPELGVWAEVWSWMVSLWEGTEGDRGLGIDPNGLTSDGDRGPEIDPDGLNDEGDRGLGIDPNG